MRLAKLALVPTLALLTLSLAACESGQETTATGGTGGTGAGAAGGATGGGGNTGSPDEPTPGPDTVVTPFDKTHIYFTGDDNKRVVDLPGTFPAEGAYSQIILHLSLDCPQGGCDSWDRFATLGVVVEKGATEGEDKVIEVARYITPYKVKGTWDIDVTHLRPLLSGDVMMRTFIDTWVGPGSVYGAGWLVTASFEMKGGVPDKLPVAVVPVWNRRYVPYGDPLKPIADNIPDQDIALPEGSSLRALHAHHRPRPGQQGQLRRVLPARSHADRG
ncbi:MAG: PNGase F N-terminal domain-containing protein [Polyangiaceae bacterium]